MIFIWHSELLVQKKKSNNNKIPNWLNAKQVKFTIFLWKFRAKAQPYFERTVVNERAAFIASIKKNWNQVTSTSHSKLLGYYFDVEAKKKKKIENKKLVVIVMKKEAHLITRRREKKGTVKWKMKMRRIKKGAGGVRVGRG